MSNVITVAGKAPFVAYSPLIAASIVNDSVPGEPLIRIHHHDSGLIVGENPESTVSYQEKGESGSQPIYGDKKVLLAIANEFPDLFYKGIDKEHWSDEWIQFATKLQVRDFKLLNPFIEELESHLTFRSFLVGYNVSLADIAVWGAIRANPIIANAARSGTFINLSRWFLYLESLPNFAAPVQDLQKGLEEKRRAEKTSTKKQPSKANFDIGLVDAVDGKVVTRFPPEPSGYLHIGHAKAAMLNQYIAQQYHGKLIVRFDDTNPTKEKMEFQDAILQDLELLGIVPDELTYSSDNFQYMFELACKMIESGKAYADDTPQEQMRNERMDGIKSQKRDSSPEENLRIFKQEMFNGTENGLKYCIRAKISIDNPNKALRDPVIYRCNLIPHHRTGDKWKVYPTYDFCVPVIDALEGVTHALRTIEYRDRNVQYEWMLEALNLRKVHIWDFSRMNFVKTVLSKRKLQWFVNEGIVPGWDDARFPTVRGVRRRGMTIQGLKTFILSQGPSKNLTNLEWNSIWTINKKVIDPVSPRYVAVIEKDAVKVKLSGWNNGIVIEKRSKHKKNPDLGFKDIYLSDLILIDQDDAKTVEIGEEITLMDWGNAIIENIHGNGTIITGIDAKLNLQGDFKKTDKKLTWLSNIKENKRLKLVDFDYLITKDKLEPQDNLSDFVNYNSIFTTIAIGDSNTNTLKQDDVIQLERKGYYRVDHVDVDEITLYSIPDGKSVQRYGAKPVAAK